MTRFKNNRFLYLILRIILVCLLYSAVPISQYDPGVKAQGPCGDTYVVQPGDTLSEIAELCGTSVEAILDLNPEVSDAGQIYTGQILRIPGVEGYSGPIVAISPECGFPGTPLTIFGSGYPANVSVEIRAGPINQPPSVDAITTSNDLGIIDTTITIPSFVNQESIWVVVAEARISNALFTGTANEYALVGLVPDPNTATTYGVIAGDTLDGIAIKFNRDINSIIRANPGLSETIALIPGQIVFIPARERGYPQTTLSPICGPPGSFLALSGRGFPTGSTLNLTSGVYLGEYQQLPAVQVNPDRTVNTTIDLPGSAQPGEHRVIMSISQTDSIFRSSSNLFSVTPQRNPNRQSLYFIQAGDTLNEIAASVSRSVSSILSANPQITNPNQLLLGGKLVIPPQNATIGITPSSGSPGTQVQALGVGFPANSIVTLGIGRLNGTFEIIGTTPVDENGLFRNPATIPADARPGENWVVASLQFNASGTLAQVISNPFVVSRLVIPGNPQISIWPESGEPGIVIHMVASNFIPKIQVNYFLGESETDLALIGSTWTEINGTFATTISIPAGATIGGTWIVVAETVEDPIVRTISTGFLVVDASAPTTTNIDIYLVDLGGGEIGCGDSVSPVSRDISPTQAPLQAAINELLSNKNRLDPDTGLYNSLYRSNLVVQSIEVLSGKATISLTGELLLDTDCDYPRAKTQLEQVSLQFSDVVDVEIVINGTLFDDIESQE